MPNKPLVLIQERCGASILSVLRLGSGCELEILGGWVLFNYHNAKSTLIKKLLKLMN